MEITQNKCRLNTLLQKIYRNCIIIRQNNYKSKKDVENASKI